LIRIKLIDILARRFVQRSLSTHFELADVVNKEGN